MGPPTAPFRAGLVGAGQISEFHVAALRRLPTVTICGAFDLDQQKAERLGSRFGLPVLSSLPALRDAGANVIHVLTPPETHAAVTMEALAAGCHALVEKPLATDVADVEAIQRLADERGLNVGVCHSLLYDPLVRKALADVKQGKLGELVAVDILRSSAYPPYLGGPLPAPYRSAGYAFRDLGVHCLYLLEAFLGPIEDVEATWRSHGGEPNMPFDEWRAQVRCERGLGQFQLSWNVHPFQSQVVLQGTKGVRRVDLFLRYTAGQRATPMPRAVERLAHSLTDGVQPLASFFGNSVRFLSGRIRPFHGVQDYVAAFYRALASGERPPVGPREALSVVRWTEEVARAADRDLLLRVPRLEPPSATPSALVTGTSGGLGEALLRRLRAETTAPIRVLVRRPPAKPSPNVDFILGNLGDPESVDRAVSGVRTVFHVGAAMKGSWTDHHCATVEGTRNVIAACRRHGVEKLVYVSSLAVIDWAGASEGSVLCEESPLEPHAEQRGAYTQAKLEAEGLVTAAAKEGLPCVILRPGQIFGGRIPLLTPAVARRAGPRWLVLGDGENPLPLVYIEDVVDALLLAARSPFRRGEIVHIVDGEVLTQNEVLAGLLGPTEGVVRVPKGPLLLLGRFSEGLFRMIGRESPVSKYRLRSALARRRFESRRAAELGWCPKVGVRAGMALLERGS